MNRDMQYKIAEGASELFFRYGTNRVRFTEIAEHVGITTRTIYNYFDNKDMLIDHVAWHNIQILHKRLLKTIEEPSVSFFEKLDLCSDVIADEMSCRQVPVSQVFSTQPGPAGDSTPEVIIHDKLLSLWETFIDQGKREGLIRKSASPWFMIQLLIISLNGLVDMLQNRIIDRFPRETFKETVKMIFHGLLTEQGREECIESIPSKPLSV